MPGSCSMWLAASLRLAVNLFPRKPRDEVPPHLESLVASSTQDG